MTRYPMTPAEYDAACRELRRRCPWLSRSSGGRSEVHNREVGGMPDSKHLIDMADDFTSPDVNGLHQAASIAVKLGLWVKVHDAGSGDHLHVQGLPVGPVPEWWSQKYLR